jgi:hypothetical protein
MPKKKMLTKKQKAAYINKPTLCPYCGSEVLHTGAYQMDGSVGWCSVVCLGCTRQWTDTYRLVGITEEGMP